MNINTLKCVNIMSRKYVTTVILQGTRRPSKIDEQKNLKKTGQGGCQEPNQH